MKRLFTFVPWVLMILIGVGVRNVYDDEQNLHQHDCVAKRAFAQTVQNFWAATEAARHSHADHEVNAENEWRSRGNLPISSIWHLLAMDDYRNARLAANYLVEQQKDFDSSCGVAPTPTPSSPGGP